MFNDLDATLRALLGDPGAPPELRSAEVSFDTPDAAYRPARATVNLFLHDVAENRELRDQERFASRTGAGWESRAPWMRVDCTYLVTAWSQHAAGLKAQEEHRLLGLTLLWLSRFPQIGTSHLQGALQDPPQPCPAPLAVGRAKDGQVLSHFWSALGVTPRPYLSVTATIALSPSDEVERFPELKAVQLRHTSLDQPVLTGRVVDPALAPVPGATVTLIDQDGAALGVRTTDEHGVVAFADVAFAAYRMQVRAPGHPDQDRSLLYARDRQVHDVVLPEP